MMSVPAQQRTQRVQSLKTYSRRVKSNTEEPQSKKRRVEEPEIVPHAPPANTFARSSIQSYFKPLSCPSRSADSPVLQRASSPGILGAKDQCSRTPRSPLRACQNPHSHLKESPSALEVTLMSSSSDCLSRLDRPPDYVEPGSCLPSSPSSEMKTPLELSKGWKKPRRRLTTRPRLAPPTMVCKSSSRFMDDDDEGSGGFPSDDCTTPDSDGPAADKDNHWTSRNRGPTRLFNPFAVPPPGRKLSKPKSYQQLQIDLGGAPKLIDCSTCRMEYNPTVKQDSANHDKFHREFLAGLKLPYRSWSQYQVYYEIKDGAEHRILVIDYRASILDKQHFEEILKRTYRDLSGTPISFPWEQIGNPQDLTDQNPVPRYRLYVYIIGLEAVSLILAERVGYAAPYYFETRIGTEGVKLDYMEGIPGKVRERVDMNRVVEVYMSVDRVWTLPDQRRKGYATKLIDVARETFINGLELTKKQISFSPPTRMGHKFAAKYCEKVYANEDFELLVDPRDLLKATLEDKSLAKVQTSLGNMEFRMGG